MPYRSAKQRAFMHINHPDIAKRWDKEYGGEVKPMAKKMSKEAKKNAAMRKVQKKVEEKKNPKGKKKGFFSNAASGSY